MLIRSTLFRRPVVASVLVLACWAGPATAQTAPRDRQPADRTIPGFSVADSSPMSIEHVDPLHATSLALFSTLRKQDLIPRDIAAELLPWLPVSQDRPEPLTALIQTQRDLTAWGAFRQYAAFSIAISQDVTPRGATESLSQLAFAARSFVLSGRLNARLTGLMTDYLAANAAVLKAASAARQVPDNPKAAEEADETLALAILKTRELLQEMSEAPKNRVGLLIEVGGAQILRVPSNTLSESRVARRALWVTPIYRLESRPMDVAGLVRLIDERETSTPIFDFGGRFGVRHGGVFYAIEALGRRRFTSDDAVEIDELNARVVGSITYELSRSAQVNFAFGKNYKDEFSGGGSLAASFGLRLGLGEALFSFRDAPGQQ
jgi:hypothetical protein